MLTFTEKGQRIIETIGKKGEKLFNSLNEDIEEDIDDFDSEEEEN